MVIDDAGDGLDESRALGVPFINAWSESRRLELQANVARLDELRAVMDGAGLAVTEAGYKLDAAKSALEGCPPSRVGR